MNSSTTGFPPAVLKALGNDTRWQILGLLGQGPRCVNALTCRLKVSQPAVSQHLRLLEHAGLVCKEKVGLQVHYGLVAERLEECLVAIQLLMPAESKEGNAMCEEHSGCGCRRGKDSKDCSPEQIKECHPEGGHPCEEEAGDKPSPAAKSE